ncbi:hypothetical protein [Aeromicrobium sp. CTD01-1L150]|uniref:hypothetical protein n=1 Tax=Aeromicrobium sp. CTD01-1L150 TaxID=3341830 RepID=UPI0035BF753B
MSARRRPAASQTPRRSSAKLKPVTRSPGLVDVPFAVRGASAGFSVLLIGGISAPLVGFLTMPLAGTLWLTATAALAFVVAARRIGRPKVPQLHGAVAAVGAYLLVLPLVLPFQAGRDLGQIALTLATAISVGACTSWVQDRRKNGRPFA